jgi:hypothetical protein
VFEVMLRNATRICEAKFGTLYLCEGAGLHIVATHDVPSAFGGRVFPRSAAVCSSACHPAPLFVARRTEAHRSPARPPLMLDIDNQETRVPKIMDNEKRAFSIAAFCERYDIGRTSAYEEIAAGRLQVVKAGKRTLAPADAESWLRSLPAVEPKTLVAPHALAESTNEEAHERTSRRTAVPADAAEASLKNLPELPRKHRLHRGE